MDLVHHAIIGGIGFTALSSGDHELAGIGFMAGSVFPDLDVAFMAFGKRVYLKNHQGPTHSLVLSPLFALLIAYLLTIPFGFEWIVVLATLMGIWIHSLLDYMNTYGICLLWPLNKKKCSLDAVFFITPYHGSLHVDFSQGGTFTVLSRHSTYIFYYSEDMNHINLSCKELSKKDCGASLPYRAVLIRLIFIFLRTGGTQSKRIYIMCSQKKQEKQYTMTILQTSM